MDFRLLSGCFLVAMSLSAQRNGTTDWTSAAESPSISSCQAKVVARSGQDSFDAIVEIRHAAGKNGTLSLNIIIPRASKVKTINLNEFEVDGPPAPVKPLVIGPLKGKAKFEFDGAARWPDSDTFAFELATLDSAKQTPLHKLLAEARRNDGAWLIEIKNPPKWDRSALISLSFAGAKPYLNKHVK